MFQYICTIFRNVRLVAVLAAAAPAAHGQVAFWGLDEGSGTTTLEQVSGAFDTINNLSGPTSSLWTAGIAPGSSSALAFDLTDSPKYVAAGDLNLGLGSSYTMTAWINVTAYSNSNAIIIGNELFDSNTGWMFGVKNNNSGDPSMFFDVGSSRREAGGFAPVAGTPTFVAFVKDAVNDQAIFYMYQGGTMLSVAVADTRNDAPRTDAVNIGVFQPAGNVGAIRQFNGVIDEVGIYNSALTSTQLTAIAAVPEPSTVALFTVSGLFLILLVRRRRAA